MDRLDASQRVVIGSGESPGSGKRDHARRAWNQQPARPDAVARDLMSCPLRRDRKLLDIARIAMDHERVTYALSGEITADQMERQQIATAEAAQQERLKKRLEQVRAEYQQRVAKLKEAWALTKAALKP